VNKKGLPFFWHFRQITDLRPGRCWVETVTESGFVCEPTWK